MQRKERQRNDVFAAWKMKAKKKMRRQEDRVGEASLHLTTFFCFSPLFKKAKCKKNISFPSLPIGSKLRVTLALQAPFVLRPLSVSTKFINERARSKVNKLRRNAAHTG